MSINNVFLSVFIASLFAISSEPTHAATKAGVRVTKIVNNHEVYRRFGPTTDKSMLDILSYDDFKGQPSDCEGRLCKLVEPAALSFNFCYLGSLDQHVCDTLQRLSDNAVSDYTDGLHELVEMTSCTTMTEKSAVRASFEVRHDWEANVLLGVVELPPCNL
jgi:hypothetical protein